ncbi:phosphotransferase [Nitrosomonas sp. Nm166]|uniref:phosphotransferase n=1 Tax=Nitrosomonas sp. Nm166 TaxID=1881054 RepID=UPI0008EE7F35|nr:phosphotransferase [Nitrosomonas sp. Nm166]SFD91588.1 Phosphotransferase enzyme family protein [Nitrosomonas sp. Nm166]
MDTTLDFRFGWRWLLPLQAGRDIRLFGFVAEEELFWREAMQCKEDARYPEILLVNGTHCPEHSGPSDAEIDAAHLVCVIANRTQGWHWRKRLKVAFPQLREYGLLPAGVPRVVIPLTTSQMAVTALGLHRPGRLIARLGLCLAGVLASVGNFALLRSRVLLIASRESTDIAKDAVQATGCARYDKQVMDYALYLGTPDDNRKTVVLPLGSSSPTAILKVAATSRAHASLKNEADALHILSKSSLAARVPKLYETIESNSTLTLYLEYQPRKLVNRQRMNEAVVAFLAELSQLSAVRVPLADLMPTLPAIVSEELHEETVVAYRKLCIQLQQLAESGALISMHRCHGDFAPWNCAWTEQGLFVFDWEASKQRDLTFGDAFYYVTAPALLVQHNANAQAVLTATLQMSGKIAVAVNIDETEVEIYLALWLLSRLHQGDLYEKMLVLIARSWP